LVLVPKTKNLHEANLVAQKT